MLKSVTSNLALWECVRVGILETRCTTRKQYCIVVYLCPLYEMEADICVLVFNSQDLGELRGVEVG